MSRSEHNQISRRVLLASAGPAAGATLTAGASTQAAVAEQAVFGPAVFGPVKIRPGDPRYENLSRGNNFRHGGRPDEIRVAGSTDQVVRAVTEAVRAGRRVRGLVRHHQPLRLRLRSRRCRGRGRARRHRLRPGRARVRRRARRGVAHARPHRGGRPRRGPPRAGRHPSRRRRCRRRGRPRRTTRPAGRCDRDRHRVTGTLRLRGAARRDTDHLRPRPREPGSRACPGWHHRRHRPARHGDRRGRARPRRASGTGLDRRADHRIPGVHATGAFAAAPDALERIADAVVARHLFVPIASSFPLDRIREAVALQAAGHVHGKIVITP